MGYSNKSTGYPNRDRGQEKQVDSLSGARLRHDPLFLCFHALAGAALLFIIAPILGLLLHSSPSELTETAMDREVRESIWLTLWTSMSATLLLSVVAVPLGYVLAREKFPMRGFVTALIDIPIVIPHSAAGIAVLGLLGTDFIGTKLGIMAAMAFVSVPYLISAAREGFAAVPERLERAAFTLGASRARVFFTISRPLAWRARVSGLILMWGRGMSEFGAVLIIAYKPTVTPILIWERFGEYGLSYARPLALLFIGICLILFVAVRVITWRGPNVNR